MSNTIISRTFLVATGIAAAVSLAACTGSFSGTAGPGTNATINTVPDTTVAQAPAVSGNGESTPQAVPAAPPPAAAATPTQHTAPAKASLTPECKAANLRLSFGGGDAGMSHEEQVLRFTNKSSTACVVVGFPGVSYVAGDKGTQVGAPAVREGKIGPQVTLAPGQTASTVITSVEVGVFDPGQCHPTAVRGYRVYAPDDTAAMFIPLSGGVQGCAGTSPSPQLRVVSIQAGLGDPDAA